MARNTCILEIQSDRPNNRDQGKNFLITEWPPRKADAWATRALSALSRNLSDDVREKFREQGLAGLAVIGVRAITSLGYDEAGPLLDEMLECVTVIPDMSKIDQFTKLPIVRPLTEEDIEEVPTLWQLRDKVFELHTGFSVAAFLSDLGETAKTTETVPSSEDTPTSPSS